MTAVDHRRWDTRGLGRFESAERAADPFAFVTALGLQAAIVLVGFDYTVTKGASMGLVIGLVTLPLWISTMRRYSLAPTILVLAVLCVPSGYVLSRLSSVDHAVDGNLRTSWFGLILSGVAGMAIILWARTKFPLHRVVLLYGIGALADAVMFGNMSWKFDLAEPTTFVVLGIVERFNNRLVPAVAVLVIGVFGVLDEGRSFFGFCLIAATLTFWQMRPVGKLTKAARWFPVVLMVGICAAIYSMGTTLLTSGALGATLQERSTAQIQATGSLLAGGRPEWAATRELIRLNPEGFGAGVVPSWADLQAGRTGLASINIDAGGYTTNYLFGNGFELHSVAADLWVSFGFIGAALAVVILVALVRSMSFLIAERRAATSVLFACALALWYLCFGPIYSNWLDICVALGLALVVRDRDRTAEDGPVPGSTDADTATGPTPALSPPPRATPRR